jgi:hypothetical protein
MSRGVRTQEMFGQDGSVNGWSWGPIAIAILLVAVVVAVWGGHSAAGPITVETPTAAATATQAASSASPAATTGDASCADGLLNVGDLPKLDAVWQARLKEFTAEASAWHKDAKLVKVGLFCYLSVDADWSADFSSADGDAQVVLPDNTESGGASLIDSFDPATISFTKLHDWLIAAGYDDATAIPNGIDVSTFFAPSGTPAGVAFYRISHADSPGEAYVFVNVDSRDGKVFTSDL